MRKIDEFNINNVSKFDKLFAFLYECICCVLLGICLRELSIISFYILYLPIFVIITLIIHESIHIVFFKIFNKKSKIKIINNHFKQIFMYQSNKEIYYNKYQTIIILLAPLILISLISFIIMNLITIKSFYLLFFINAIINAMGSVTDLISSLKLFIKYFNKKVFIKYELQNNEVNIIIYIKTIT